jgi:dCMP deaminase
MKASNEAKNIVIAYVPVLHEGYRRFFERHSDADRLFLIGSDVIKDFKPLAKDLRALPPELMKEAVGSLKYFKEIKVIDYSGLKALGDLNASDDSNTKIVMPDEDFMHEFQAKYFSKAKVEYDPIFLRWDKHKSFEGKPVEADQTISKDEFDRNIIKGLKKEAEKSADFWRQIGAAVIKDGKVILKAHNKAVPDEQMNYIEGDPRSDFSKGVNVELSLFFHCEAQLIAEAAKKGISLEGTSMYVTTFPCPPCAKLVAYSGIKKLYYADGYGVLDGERVLKSQGVEIVFVDNS